MRKYWTVWSCFVCLGLFGLVGFAQDADVPKTKEEAEQRSIEAQKKLADATAAAQGVQKAAADATAALTAVSHDAEAKTLAAQTAAKNLPEAEKKAASSEAALDTDSFKTLEQE